jgi:hypothetical protein
MSGTPLQGTPNARMMSLRVQPAFRRATGCRGAM